MAQVVSCPLSPERPDFTSGPVYAGFVMDKVALGQNFTELFGFPLSISFRHGSLYSYVTWEMTNKPAGGRSSETQFRPVDMNDDYNTILGDISHLRLQYYP
jgi:hypothetical protein